MDLGQISVRIQRELSEREFARTREGFQRIATTRFDWYVVRQRNLPLCILWISIVNLVQATNSFRVVVLSVTAGLLVLCTLARPATAQFYAGAMGGVATLSGDTRAIINSTSTAFATYNPQNGLALNPLLGRHLSDIFTMEGEYDWNRNRLNLTGATFTPGAISEFEQARSSSQQSLFASVLVYFRARKSRIRPYLSTGTGWVHLSSVENSISNVQGSPVLPPHQFSANMIALRVPVGIDVTVQDGWRFRYSFSETISRDPISHELSPPGLQRLKNFQNLFGIVRRF